MRSQDQKGTYVFVHMWNLDFYTHTRTQACMHAHTHAHAHICTATPTQTKRYTHSLIWEGRPAKRVTREGDEQI